MRKRRNTPVSAVAVSAEAPLKGRQTMQSPFAAGVGGTNFMLSHPNEIPTGFFTITMRATTPSERRVFIQALSGAGAAIAIPALALAPQPHIDRPAVQVRVIPGSGEYIAAVGMGSWLTFDIAGSGNPDFRADALRAVLQTFFDRGGVLIDTSPMYGSSEQVIGELLRPGVNAVAGRDRVFAASKVWTIGEAAGRGQMENSLALWRAGGRSFPGNPSFDLLQIHNMMDWQTHLGTLKTWKAAGRIRYVGITTSHGSRSDELEVAMKRERFDFVQFTYNLTDRRAESRLLPLARDRGAAVIINRPFDGGGMFRRTRGKPMPAWATELGCRNWADFFLKFILSHPAVTCAIPATSQASHMAENMNALLGELPDAGMRRRMVEHWERSA